MRNAKVRFVACAHDCDAAPRENPRLMINRPLPKQIRVRLRKRDMIGMCLRCGRKLTFCGKPFTAEIPCSKCLCINVYNESLQPVSAR